MIRKSLFWGLTLVLAAALISLVIRSRRLEKEQAQQMVEVVRESTPTLTRVFAPQDLQVTQAMMQLENEPGNQPKAGAARHQIEIRNNGTMSYSDIQLKFDYVGRDGKKLSSRTWLIQQKILPGTTLRVPEIVMRDIPASTADSKISITSADLAR